MRAIVRAAAARHASASGRSIGPAGFSFRALSTKVSPPSVPHPSSSASSASLKCDDAPPSPFYTLPLETKTTIRRIAAASTDVAEDNIMRELLRESNAWVACGNKSREQTKAINLTTSKDNDVSTLTIKLRGASFLPIEKLQHRLAMGGKKLNGTVTTKQLTSLGYLSSFACGDNVTFESRDGKGGGYTWGLDKTGATTSVRDDTLLGGEAGTDITIRLKDEAQQGAFASEEALRDATQRCAHWVSNDVDLTCGDALSSPLFGSSAFSAFLSSNDTPSSSKAEGLEVLMSRFENAVMSKLHRDNITTSPLHHMGGGISLLPNFDIKKFFSFLFSWTLSYRWIFIYFFRFAFQSSRVFLSIFIFGTLLKGLLATTLTPSYLLTLSFIIGFEMAYGLLQVYIACTFIAYFMTNIL